MKLKIEFIDGSVGVVKVEQVLYDKTANKLEFIYCSFKKVGEYPLVLISRAAVDNEVIYDHMGRKENHKKEK